MTKPDILCIGSVLWDIIGRSVVPMRVGSDVPGRITRLPGGVAMNIAMTLARFDLRPALITSIGTDANGQELERVANEIGLITDYMHRSPDLPTDSYMAIEGANGVIAAIADAHSLEEAGDAILAPLSDGRLSSEANPWNGLVALDGNLTVALLEQIAGSSLFAKADLRVAPASPGKAERLLALINHPSVTFYVNLEEARLICGAEFENAEDAACALVARGVSRALVTDGCNEAADATDGVVHTATPPTVHAVRLTGAGDTFMAAHIAAERSNISPLSALQTALNAAAAYVAGEDT